MNYGGQDQRYNGGQGLTDGYGEYEGEKNYYGQQGPSGQQLPSFPFSSLRNSQQQQQASHPYHGGLHQPSPNNLLGERVLPPMSSVARGQQSMPAGSDLGVNALSAAAAAHQMSRLGEAFKDSLAHQMGPSSKAGGLGPSPYGVSLPQQQYGMPSASSHSDRLYGGSANPFPSHTSAGSGMGGAMTEKSSPRSSTQRGSSDNGYGLPTSTRGSGDRGIQLPAPSMASQLGNGAAHQAAVSLSHIAGGGGANSQLHSSSNSVPQQQQPVRTAASMNPKGTPPSAR